MKLDKELPKWCRRFLVLIMLYNLVSLYVTWEQYGFYAALGWLSTIMMIIGLIGADLIIDRQRKTIQELDNLCERTIKEYNEYVEQHKEASTEQGTR